MLDESIKDNVLDKFDKDVKDFEKEIMEIKDNRVETEKRHFKSLDDKRIKRYENIQQNSEETYEEMSKLDEKYQEYIKVKDAEELNSKFNSFKTDCEYLIHKKKSLIEQIWNEVRQNEEDYVKAVNVFSLEFEETVSKTKSEFVDMREKINNYLTDIEKQLLDQREKIIKENKENVEALFSKHEKTEAEFIENRNKEETQNYQEIKQLKQDKNKEFFDLKIFLENEIQNHEKCLEDMKAIYQLNAEKLNYNFKVLNDKKEENEALAAVLKKKERFFINLLKRKNDEFYYKDIEYRKINKKLTEQNKTIVKQYKDLHKKFKYFEIADIERYEQIKDMNIKDIDDLKEKIQKCNNIIMEQQLDIEKENILINNGKKITTKTESNNETLNTMPQKSVSFISNQQNMRTDQKGDSINNISVNAIVEFSSEQKHDIFNIIANETEFLIDDKMVSEIEECKTKDTALVLKLDILKKVFNLKDKKEMNSFFRMIYDSCYDPTIDEYDIDELIGSLASFMERKNEINNNTNRKSVTKIKNKKMKSMKKKAEADDEWNHLNDLLDQTTLDIWKGLEKFSTDYYGLLLERKATIEMNRELMEETQQLNGILEGYSKRNHRLIFAPDI